jgi:hypothetical protein
VDNTQLCVQYFSNLPTLKTAKIKNPVKETVQAKQLEPYRKQKPKTFLKNKE